MIRVRVTLYASKRMLSAMMLQAQSLSDLFDALMRQCNFQPPPDLIEICAEDGNTIVFENKAAP